MTETSKEIKDTEPRLLGGTVKHLVSAFCRYFVPVLLEFIVFLAIWVFFVEAMEYLGWIEQPGWWMSYGIFVGNTAWWVSCRCNKNIRLDIDNFFSRQQGK